MKDAETGSGRIARTIVGRRGLLALVSLSMGLVLGLGILSTSFNTSVGELLSDQDPYLDHLELMEERFPSSLTVSFAVTDGQSVFSQQVLAMLRDLHTRYEELPGAQRLSSLLTWQSPAGGGALFDRPSDTYSQQELDTLHEQTLEDAILTGTVLSEDARLAFATAFIDIDDASQAARLQLADATIALAESLRLEHPGVSLYINSDALFERSTQDAMVQDLTTLLPIVILICVLVICYCFHSITFGACILAQALLSVLCTVGVVGYAGIGFNTISVIAPLVVVIISVAHSVHIISVYKQRLFLGRDYVEAMQTSVDYNFKPVLLATLTTAIGFLSLNLSSSPAIQDFGRIVALGIGFALLFTFSLLPALLIWISMHTRAHGKTMDSVLPNRLIRAVVPFWQRKDRQIFLFCTALAVVTVGLLPLNETDFDRLDFIEADSEAGAYYDIVSRGLQRGPTLAYGIQAASSGGAIEPAFLQQVDSFTNWLLDQPEVLDAGSLVEVVKTISLARGGQDPAYYRIPDDVLTIDNDLALYLDFELPDFPLADFVDENYETVRLILNATPLSNQQLVDFDSRVFGAYQEFLPDARLISGSPIMLFARMDSLVTVELMQGYTLSLLLITLTLIIGFRSFYFGLLSIAPNLLPATIVFGAWGLFVGQLDPFVMMLFSISIGLVVDDTVHILSHYLDFRKQGSSVEESFNRSLDTAGPALVVTTAVLALGTTILIGASTLYFQQAAKLLVPIVVLALALDLLYLPTLLKRLDRRSVATGGVEG